jgi:hypothetical protein
MNAQTPEAQPEIPQSSTKPGLQLPEPDRENITVLLHNLPKAPVLPWNRYDSPWEESSENGDGEDAPLTDPETPTAEAMDTPTEESTPETLPDEPQNTGEEGAVLVPIEALPQEVLMEETQENDDQEVSPNAVHQSFEPGFVNLSPYGLASVSPDTPSELAQVFDYVPPSIQEQDAEHEEAIAADSGTSSGTVSGTPSGSVSSATSTIPDGTNFPEPLPGMSAAGTVQDGGKVAALDVPAASAQGTGTQGIGAQGIGEQNPPESLIDDVDEEDLLSQLG